MELRISLPEYLLHLSFIKTHNPMKTTKIMVLASLPILILTLFFSGCAKEENIANEVAGTEAGKKSAQNYGEFHNEFLQLVERDGTDWSLLNTTQIGERLKELMIPFANSELGIDSTSAQYYVELELQRSPDNINTLIQSVSNSALRICYYEIYGAVEEAENYKDFDNILNKARTKAIGALSREEIELVDIVIDISLHSWQYWEANESVWEGKISDRAKRVIGGDVNGAIGGAIGGAITGGPIGGILGAALGAPIGSILSAISLFIW